MMSYNPCAVIPVYRHGKTLPAVCERLEYYGLPIIVVDDGNEADTKEDINQVHKRFTSVEIVQHAKNQGKGGAVRSGILHADALGYSHAFQIDADGQHGLEQIPFFLEQAKLRGDGSIICGHPVYDESVPSSRKTGRKITNMWVHIETLSTDIVDAMCGFRVYPVKQTAKVLRHACIGLRMTFDIEILVRLYWKGVSFVFFPLKVIYPEGGISNFRMVKDNIAISAMHTKLFIGMIVRLPFLLFRSYERRRKGV